MFKQDYIVRLVEELARAVQSALRRADEQRFEEAEAELDQAEQSLGLLRNAQALDARSLASLLGGDKCALYAQILLARAQLAERRASQASPSRASALRGRALALLSHAEPRELGGLKAELLEWLDSAGS